MINTFWEDESILPPQYADIPKRDNFERLSAVGKQDTSWLEEVKGGTYNLINRQGLYSNISDETLFNTDASHLEIDRKLLFISPVEKDVYNYL